MGGARPPPATWSGRSWRTAFGGRFETTENTLRIVAALLSPPGEGRLPRRWSRLETRRTRGGSARRRAARSAASVRRPAAPGAVPRADGPPGGVRRRPVPAAATVAGHGPSARIASPSPGHGGIVTPKHAEGIVAGATKLEGSADGDGEARAGRQDHRLLAVIVAPPHLAGTAGDEPDLLDRPVAHGHRRLARRQLEVGGAAGTDGGEDADGRPVGRDGVGLGGERGRLERHGGVSTGDRRAAGTRDRKPSGPVDAPPRCSGVTGSIWASRRGRALPVRNLASRGAGTLA